MKPKITGLAILVLFFLISTSAFGAQVTFTPRTTATETYTDNVDQTDEDAEEDYITDVTVGGTLSILGQTSAMELTFDPGYAWYKDNTDNNTWRLPASLNIWNDFSRRTRLTISDYFIRSEDPEGDEAVVSETDGEILAPGDTTSRTGRDWYYTNQATARVDHQFGSDDTVYGEFLYSLRREEASGGNDNDRYAPSAGMTYWFGPKWGTSVEATYTKAKFDNSADYDDIAGRFQLMRRFSRMFQLFGRYGYVNRNNDNDVPDYQIHAPSAGFIYDVAPDARISLGAGYYYQDFKDSDIDDEEGPFINGEVYKLWTYQRWNARLLGNAGLDRNDFGSDRLGFEQFAGITGNATYNFTRDFYGNVTGEYRYSDTVNLDRTDNRYTTGVGLGWGPTTWMDLTLDYTYNKLKSTGDDRGEPYDENRVWFRITLQPDQPWRW